LKQHLAFCVATLCVVSIVVGLLVYANLFFRNIYVSVSLSGLIAALTLEIGFLIKLLKTEEKTKNPQNPTCNPTHNPISPNLNPAFPPFITREFNPKPPSNKREKTTLEKILEHVAAKELLNTNLNIELELPSNSDSDVKILGKKWKVKKASIKVNTKKKDEEKKRAWERIA